MTRQTDRSVFHRTAPLAAATVLALAGASSAVSALGQDGSGAKVHERQAERDLETVRTIEEWNLEGRSRLALKGYDPVGYFPEGGGKAKKGSDRYTLTHRGVTYRFASAANRDLFRAAPDRYEPAYGGWCAWAMTRGTKTEVDPKNFIVKNDRLFVFYKGLFADTRDDWRKGNHASLARRADDNWRDISEEEPRRVQLPSEDG
ncbi:MAG: YHS domain-containing (seleno)protein [Planctomycetota bacterium]